MTDVREVLAPLVAAARALDGDVPDETVICSFYADSGRIDITAAHARGALALLEGPHVLTISEDRASWQFQHPLGCEPPEECALHWIIASGVPQQTLPAGRFETKLSEGELRQQLDFVPLG